MDRNLLDQAQKALFLKDVYFERATAEIIGDFNPAAEDQSLSVQFKRRVVDTRRSAVTNSAGEKELVRIVAECGMRLIGSAPGDTDATPDEKALIFARLVSEYVVIDELSDAALGEFAKHNGPYHAWPFWREYVHTACARLRIPLVPVPMYKLPKPPEPSESDAG